MKPEMEMKLQKIKRVSNIFRSICKMGLVLAACVFVAATVAILTGHGTLSFSGFSVPLAPLTFPSRFVLAAITALTIAVGVKGIYHLYQLFGNYGRGDIFTTESAGQIRQLGITVLLWYGANLLWAFTAVAVQRTPVVGQFHSDSLVTGPIIIVISWFMEMAAEMREENELTI
ncbi:MAG TPA: DUF2975 domain-containing protein [Verrucomicrobiae bacterium]|nr:DUF2975 domain-containing protein [Verrucomicrobiae bacterium]